LICFLGMNRTIEGIIWSWSPVTLFFISVWCIWQKRGKVFLRKT
jgi:hypothetical protein